MKEKMKIDQDEEVKIFTKNVSGPSNPPDKLAQNVSEKILPDELFLHFFLRKFRI